MHDVDSRVIECQATPCNLQSALMGKLMLLDGHSLAYRAFFALPPDLTSESGQVTNAVYGFTSMLLKAIDDQRPTGICVCFDKSDKTFRNDEYEFYKAGRVETPELFRSQVPFIHEVLKVLRIPQVEIEGYEADDIIATLATQAAEDGEDVVIVTGDRDAFQLVEDPHIKVMYNKRGISDVDFYDEAGIEERFGVTPGQYIDYAALRGDASDNLPGVKGVGEKTAAKLLNKYKDIEGIYANLDQLTPKLRESLDSSKEQVELNRRLTRLVRDVPLEMNWRDCVQGRWDREEVRRLFNSLSFRTLLERAIKQLPAAGAGVAPAGRPEVLEVEVLPLTCTRELSKWLEENSLSDGVSMIAADASGYLEGLAIACNSKSAAWIAARDVWESKVFKSWLADSRRGKIGHRIVETLRLLDFPEIDGLVGDTAIAAYLLDPAESKYFLDDTVFRYLGIELKSPDDSHAKAQGTLSIDSSGMEVASKSASAITGLAVELSARLEQRGLAELYRDVELPLVGVLARMEQVGVRLDLDYIEELAETFRDRCRQYEAEIHRLAGKDFNVNSTPQLREILFEKLGLPPTKKVKTGYSTDAASLEAIRDQHPIVEALLAYREVEKLRSTVDGFPPLVSSDGRLHPRYNQTAAATGRISSESPNVQNVPVRTEIGRQIRRAFVAEDGWRLCSADYNQIELRVLAHISQDPGLLAAFRSGHDVHQATAAMVFGVDPNEVSDEMRRQAKMVNYGLSYGLEAFGLAQRLGIGNSEAQTLMDAYFENFPGVRVYMDTTVSRAKADGFTETIFGRRRYLPELEHRSYQVRKMGERMAMNAPIQGTAADIIKVAMIRVDAELAKRGLASRQILQVHDELVVEVAPGEEDEVPSLLADLMEDAANLDVPLKVDVGIGRNWDSAKSNK